MTFLPIVERELRVASRRRSTYLGRLTGALVAIAMGGWVMLAAGRGSPGRLGGVLFVALSAMLFLYSLAAGGRITADCLSEEKREGTLGLLFLTDLKGYDIVAGKLVANSLNTFYGLLSAFPVLAISILMGGVTSTEFWRVSLVSVSLLFLSLATGMFASSVCRDERKAMSLTFLILLILLGATPLVELLLNLSNRNYVHTNAWLIFSPAFSCFTAFGARIGFSARDFWIPVLLTHGYGWILLVLASSIVPNSWQDRAARNPASFRNFWRKLAGTKPAQETTRRTRLLEINPFLWLAARDPMKTSYVWVVLLVLAVLWLWGLAKWPQDWLEMPNYIFTAIVLHTILKFWLTSEACYRFVQDRKSGALELLLSTPLSVNEILRGQRLALFRQFSGPVLIVLAIDLFFLSLGLKNKDLSRSDERTFWILLWLAGMSIFVMDLFALSWVSMWVGLTSRKVNRAGNAAIGRILVVPWMVFLFSITIAGIASVFSIFRWDEKVALLYWTALCVVNNVIFTNWARQSLRNRFRDVATQRFEAKPNRFAWFQTRSPEVRPDLPPVIQ